MRNRQILGQQILGRPLGLGGSSVVTETMGVARVEPVVFPETSIAAGATANVVVRPQRIFRGEKLIAFGTGLVIQDITTEQRSIFASPGNVPIATFGPTVYENQMQVFTVQVGGDITIRVQNPTAGAVVFNAIWFGKTLSPS